MIPFVIEGEKRRFLVLRDGTQQIAIIVVVNVE